jgi:L-ascorbate metabolism protein UlaG (beta-lactamase superfamily)
MIITYHGAECFKISQGDLTLALNPISKDSKFKPARFGADITLITTNHPDFNGSAYAKTSADKREKEPFVIDSPGEYEIKGVFIKGFLSEGLGKKTNTIYLISFEGLNLCFLGALTDPALSTETLESIEDVDILFIPVSKDTLDPATAYKLAVSLEPSVIIPMYYSKETEEQFIKEGGAKVEPQDKFVVKKKDLEGKEAEIVILKEE